MDDRTPGDVVVRLAEPGELFAVDSRGLLTGSDRLVSGMDEIVERFLAQERIGRRQRIVLDLPTTAGSPDLAESMQRAVRRYCQLRIDDCHRQRDVVWRQGRRSLWSGAALFVVGILLSFLFSRPEEDELVRALLGDGVFLVVAWIGLWYPLDILLTSRQPLRREIRVLSEIKTLPVEVRTRRLVIGDAEAAETAEPQSPRPGSSQRRSPRTGSATAP